MTGHETMLQRLERKYFIDEPTAERIRRDVEAYCAPDPHNPACSGLFERPHQSGYAICSLYLDSPNLAFYQANMRGDWERIKLRARTYSCTSPAMLELKRRISDVIDKTRVAVNRKDAEQAAVGLAGPAEDGSEAERRLGEFALAVAVSGAGPTLHLRYEREAYVSIVDNYARVCFDRHIRARRIDDWDLDPDPTGYTEFDHFWRADFAGNAVVLELKCESAIPHWMTDLVHHHGLNRTSFSKYAVGVHLTGRTGGQRGRSVRDARVMA